jgi:hypothetical protein
MSIMQRLQAERKQRVQQYKLEKGIKGEEWPGLELLTPVTESLWDEGDEPWRGDTSPVVDKIFGAGIWGGSSRDSPVAPLFPSFKEDSSGEMSEEKLGKGTPQLSIWPTTGDDINKEGAAGPDAKKAKVSVSEAAKNAMSQEDSAEDSGSGRKGKGEKKALPTVGFKLNPAAPPFKPERGHTPLASDDSARQSPVSFNTSPALVKGSVHRSSPLSLEDSSIVALGPTSGAPPGFEPSHSPVVGNNGPPSPNSALGLSGSLFSGRSIWDPNEPVNSADSWARALVDTLTRDDDDIDLPGQSSMSTQVNPRSNDKPTARSEENTKTGTGTSGTKRNRNFRKNKGGSKGKSKKQ